MIIIKGRSTETEHTAVWIQRTEENKLFRQPSVVIITYARIVWRQTYNGELRWFCEILVSGETDWDIMVERRTLEGAMRWLYQRR